MKKRKNKMDRLAMGIFVDGLTLQIATLCVQKGKVKLVDANLLNLVTRLEPAKMEEPVFAEEFALDGEDGVPIDITSQIAKSDEPQKEGMIEEYSDNASILETEIGTYTHRKFKLGISVSEPEIYYAPFNTNWGLKGDALKQRIIESLTVEKPSAADLIPSDIQVVEVANKDLLAIIRGTEFHVVNLIEQARHHLGNKATRISFIEGAEISLVNLIKKNYKFEPNEISAIVYVGHEFGRLIFMLGNELLGISQIIGEGTDSLEISHTIYSRLLLELDNLNLKKMDNIILCGEAYEADLLPFLKDKFSHEADIDYLNFNNIEANGIDPLLSRYAVAIGVAWRALEEKNDDLYQIDLMPKFVRERQKIFKLGVWGWLLILLLPALTFLITIQAGQMKSQIEGLEQEFQDKRVVLQNLEEPKKELEVLKLKVAGYENVFAKLDSLLIGTKTYSYFFTLAANTAKKVGGIWITDIKSSSENRLTLFGYSLYRSNIPKFSNMLGKSVLNKVEVQEIREKTVYNFEIQIDVEQK